MDEWSDKGDGTDVWTDTDGRTSYEQSKLEFLLQWFQGAAQEQQQLNNVHLNEVTVQCVQNVLNIKEDGFDDASNETIHPEDYDDLSINTVIDRESTGYDDELPPDQLNSIASTVAFLTSVDNKYKVPQEHPEYQVVAEEAVKIIRDALNGVDERFKANILPSGSFYEDLKVGEPDEFDFMVQITSLSQKGVCHVLKSEFPGFVHVTVRENYAKQWKDCLALICRHKKRMNECDYCALTDPLTAGATIILAPEKVQDAFRHNMNSSMRNVKLPENWRHRGWKEPDFSGFRRHGPATMFLFYYKLPYDKEIEISLDITLSIELEIPLIPYTIDFFPGSRIPADHVFQRWYNDMLHNGIDGNSPLQLIPLYSKIHVREKYFGSKNCWRVSCSLIERELLNRFDPENPDSVPKRCIRLMKWIRDKYLTDNKEQKQKKKKKNKKIHVTSDYEPDVEKLDESMKYLSISERDTSKKQENIGQVLNCEVSKNGFIPVIDREYFGREYHVENDINAKNVNEHVNETLENQEALGMAKEKPDYKTMPKVNREFTGDGCTRVMDHAGFIVDDDIPGLYKNFPKVFQPSEPSEDTTSEVTTYILSNRSNLGKVDFRSTHFPTVAYDREVEDMKSDPACREYYGPITYVTSIELKTMVLFLMEAHPLPEQWSLLQLPKVIYDVFTFLHDKYASDECLQNFFFEVRVISPYDWNKINKALEKLRILIQMMDSDWIPIQKEHKLFSTPPVTSSVRLPQVNVQKSLAPEHQ